MARRRGGPAAKKAQTSADRKSISWLLGFAVVLFLLSRFYILFVLEPQISDVENTYFAYAIRAHDAHLAPYTDELSVEYPPLAWWLIDAPRLLNPQHIVRPQQLQPALEAYKSIFRGAMFVCDLGSAILILLIVKRRHPALLGWAALTYTVTTTVFCHLLYDRLDMGLLLLFLAWAFCWLRSWDDSAEHVTWSTAAYVFLGLSISFKLIPGICVPFVLLADWRGSRRWSRLSVCLVALIVAAGLPFFIQYLISGPGVFSLLKYHGERRIQIESLYSTLMMVGALLGSPVFVVESHSAFDLEGSLATFMTALSTVLLYGFLAGVWLWAFLRRANYRADDAYRLICFVMAGAVILSKVLSPQYFLWAMPIVLLLAADLFPRRGFTIWLVAVLQITIAALTTWLFPYHYRNEPGHVGLLPINSPDPSLLSLEPCIVLGIRNFLYLATIVWLGWVMFRPKASHLDEKTKLDIE